MKLRKWDVENPTRSNKMKWLMRDAFPGHTPDEIYGKSKELYRATTAEARDNTPPTAQNKVQLAKAVVRRPVSFRTGEEAGKGSEHVDVVDSHDVPANSEPIGNGEVPIGYYDRTNGRIKIFADRVHGPDDAKWIAWHELTHRGLDVKYGNDYGLALEKLEKNPNLKSIADKIAERRGIDQENLSGKYDALEEAAAEVSAADATGDFGRLKDEYGVDFKRNPLSDITWRKPLEALKAIWNHILGHSDPERVLQTLRDVREAGRGNGEPTLGAKFNFATRDPKTAPLNAEGEALRKTVLSRFKANPYDEAKLNERLAKIVEKYSPKYTEPHPSLIAQKRQKGAEEVAKLTTEADESSSIARLGKVGKFARAWSYGAMLSSLRTIPKILATSATETAIRPIEEIMGSVTAKLFPKTAAMSDRYGSGPNKEAEAKAFSALFNLDEYKSMMLTGRTSLDQGISKILEENKSLKETNPEEYYKLATLASNYEIIASSHNGILAAPGRLHGVLHTPPMLAEAARSIVKRTAGTAKRLKADGMSDSDVIAAMADPLTQADIQVASYKDALEAAYRGTNTVSRVYDALVRYLQTNKSESSGVTKFLATLLEATNPFVRVSSNLFSRVTSFGIGGLKAAAVGAHAKFEGKMTHEQADYIMKNLRSQGVGAAALILGAMFSKSFGGLYDEKHYDPKKEGTITFMGNKIPKHWLEHPMFQLMQLSAMVTNGYKEGGDKGAIEKAKAGAKDIGDIISPVRSSGDIGKALDHTGGVAKYLAQMASFRIIPGFIKDIANIEDLVHHAYGSPTIPEATGRYVLGNETISRPVKTATDVLKKNFPKTPLNPNFNVEDVARR